MCEKRQSQMFVLNLIETVYPFVFILIIFGLLILQLTIGFLIISIYFSLPWSHRFVQEIYAILFNDDQPLSKNYRDEHVQLVNDQWKNSFRRSMLLRIENLFSRPSTKTSSTNELPSLFDYRCPICLNLGKSSSCHWIALGCGHLLCSSCTRHLYFGHKPVCPHCRCPILLSDLTLLYI